MGPASFSHLPFLHFFVPIPLLRLSSFPTQRLLKVFCSLALLMSFLPSSLLLLHLVPCLNSHPLPHLLSSPHLFALPLPAPSIRASLPFCLVPISSDLTVFGSSGITVRAALSSVLPGCTLYSHHHWAYSTTALGTGGTRTVHQFSFLPPPPVSWFLCKQKHRQRGVVAHAVGVGPRVYHVRHHWVSQGRDWDAVCSGVWCQVLPKAAREGVQERWIQL